MLLFANFDDRSNFLDRLLLVEMGGFVRSLLEFSDDFWHKADAIALRFPQRALHQAPTPTDLY